MHLCASVFRIESIQCKLCEIVLLNVICNSLKRFIVWVCYYGETGAFMIAFHMEFSFFDYCYLHQGDFLNYCEAHSYFSLNLCCYRCAWFFAVNKITNLRAVEPLPYKKVQVQETQRLDLLLHMMTTLLILLNAEQNNWGTVNQIYLT